MLAGRKTQPSALQRQYYARTAELYDGMHEQLPHDMALGHVVGFIRWLGAESALDTGCGTAWGFRVLANALPDLRLRGNDPSRELLHVATSRYGVPADALDCVGSDALPYDDESFDVVVATGVMHHVPNPHTVVAEMLRVARQAVFISDANIYGEGTLPARLAKILLARAGVLRPLNWLRRRGHHWYYSEGDGVAWSYSVYDSLPQVSLACRDTLMIPTDRLAARAAGNPFYTTSHALLCGFKSPLPRPMVER